MDQFPRYEHHQSGKDFLTNPEQSAREIQKKATMAALKKAHDALILPEKVIDEDRLIAVRGIEQGGLADAYIREHFDVVQTFLEGDYALAFESPLTSAGFDQEIQHSQLSTMAGRLARAAVALQELDPNYRLGPVPVIDLTTHAEGAELTAHILRHATWASTFLSARLASQEQIEVTIEEGAKHHLSNIGAHDATCLVPINGVEGAYFGVHRRSPLAISFRRGKQYNCLFRLEPQLFFRKGQEGTKAIL